VCKNVCVCNETATKSNGKFSLGRGYICPKPLPNPPHTPSPLVLACPSSAYSTLFCYSGWSQIVQVIRATYLLLLVSSTTVTMDCT